MCKTRHEFTGYGPSEYPLVVEVEPESITISRSDNTVVLSEKESVALLKLLTLVLKD